MPESLNLPSQDELDELQEMMELVGEENDRVEKVVKVAAVDPELYEDMRTLYQRKAAQVATKDAYYPYTALTGEFLLGFDPDGRPLGVTRRQLNEHMLVVGRSGAGKTTFFYNLLETCNQKELPAMVFDFKNDYRHVADDLDLLVANWQDIKFNPLQPPPGVRPGKWGEILADTFAHATDLLIGSEGYFLQKLRELYKLYESEIVDGVYPSLFELRALVDADDIQPTSPRFNYKERVFGRLTMMTGFSGDIFDCSRGYPLDAFLDRNVVFELQEPNQYVTNFVVEAMLMWIFYYRDAIGHRQGLRHLVLFDEAKRVFDVNREKQPESGYPPIDDLMGKIREFGEGLVVADHELSKLTDSVKANTNVKLWMSLGSGHDTGEMAETFGVDEEQTDFTRTLERGEAVASVADSDPVPVTLPSYYVEKDTSTGAVQERMKAVLDKLAWRERCRPEPFLDAIGLGDGHGSVEDEDGRETEESVGDVAEELLASVDNQPFLSISERYDAIDVGSKQGNAAKEELLKLDLVREVEIETGEPGRNPKLLDLTDAGRQVLANRGYEVTDTGRRGIKHRYWQDQIKEYHEADGFDVDIEYPVEQDRIDVFAEKPGERLAVEVACSPEHEVENVEKCLEYGVDRIEIAYLSDRVRERIESALADAFGEVPGDVTFVPVSEYT